MDAKKEGRIISVTLLYQYSFLLCTSYRLDSYVEFQRSSKVDVVVLIKIGNYSGEIKYSTNSIFAFRSKYYFSYNISVNYPSSEFIVFRHHEVFQYIYLVASVGFY